MEPSPMARRRLPAPDPLPDPGAIRRAADLFRLVGDPGRLATVLLLVESEQGVGAIAEHAGLSPMSASHHLAMLRASGVVESQRDGRRVFYALTDEGRRLADAAGMLR